MNFPTKKSLQSMILALLWAQLVSTGFGQLGGARDKSDKLQISAGGSLIVSPRPYVGADPQIFPVPAVTLRYKRLFFEGIRGGVEFFRAGKFTGNAFMQAQFKGIEPDSSTFLEGMEPRRKSADAGAEILFLGRPVGFRAAFLTDILGRSGGQEVSFQAVTGAPLGKLLILGGFGPRWLSEDRVDYYYGVRPVEATPSRPCYPGTSAWNWDLSVTALYNPGPSWTLFLLFNREGFGSPITASPLIEQNAGYSLVSAVLYNF